MTLCDVERAGLPLRVLALTFAILLLAPIALALSPPSAPQSPSAVQGAGVSEIDLAWSAPASSGASPVAGYRIYRSLTSTGLTHYLDLGNVLAFTDNAVPDNAPRYYRISAVNGDGEGPLSPVVSASAKTPPTEPRSFSASTGPTRYNITLAWNVPLLNGSVNVTSYKIYRAPDWTGPFSHHATTSNRTWRDAGIPDNTTYAYRVSAVNAYGEGPMTAPVNGTTSHLASAPLNVTASMFPGFGITVEWDEPADEGSDHVDYYVIERAVGDRPFVKRAEMNYRFLHYTDTSCGPPNTCHYRVYAVNEIGNGPLSNVASSLADPLLGVLA